MTDEWSNRNKLEEVAIPIARELIEVYREKHGQEELIERLKRILKNAYDMTSDQEEEGDLPIDHLNVNNAVLIASCPYGELVQDTPVLCYAHQELLNELRGTEYKLVQCIAEGDDICIFRSS